MAALTALDDVNHDWGGDLMLSPIGDLGRSNRDDRSKQRVLRRLMTNPGAYLVHTTYGGGLPQDVGTLVDLAATQAKIKGQMMLEASVARTPAPVVAVRSIPGGIAVSVQYVTMPDKQPVALSFSVSA